MARDASIFGLPVTPERMGELLQDAAALGATVEYDLEVNTIIATILPEDIELFRAKLGREHWFVACNPERYPKMNHYWEARELRANSEIRLPRNPTEGRNPRVEREGAR